MARLVVCKRRAYMVRRWFIEQPSGKETKSLNVCNVRDRLQEHPIIICYQHQLQVTFDRMWWSSSPNLPPLVSWFGSSRWIWQDFVMWWTWLNDIALKVWSMSLGIAARGSMKWHKGKRREAGGFLFVTRNSNEVNHTKIYRVQSNQHILNVEKTWFHCSRGGMFFSLCVRCRQPCYGCFWRCWCPSNRAKPPKTNSIPIGSAKCLVKSRSPPLQRATIGCHIKTWYSGKRNLFRFRICLKFKVRRLLVKLHLFN